MPVKKSPIVFITGGAGYIGTHSVKYFLSKGISVVVFDNFSEGFRQPLDILRKQHKGLSVIKGDVKNYNQIFKALKNIRPELVIHLAARCSVDESMEKPELYMKNNVLGTANLLEAMAETGVKKIIFSSTCAVYGETGGGAVSEARELKPVNVYGVSKLLGEKLIQGASGQDGLRFIIFRFFNVCGADKGGIIGDSKKPSTLLVQNAVRGAMGISPFKLTCPKVKTPDGTPIRDYIDVEDLARAQFLAYRHLLGSGKSNILNLGSARGYSVKEIISAVEKATDREIKVKPGKLRRGEYAKIYANARKAEKVLGFRPQKTLAQSILTLKKWYQRHPNGYKY